MTKINLPEYEVLMERDIADVKSEGFLLRHKKSGARIEILANDDENKVFCIGFRTPPEDETGVAHIIEHTTLCGSDKYPAKDPFVELVKGSLNTFLNAMTYPDKTLYPVASCNEQDYKNLMSVYMDAVFHPNITKYEEIFEQEGWHYELEDADAPLRINGVVYNEMKGAYSSPDEVLQTQILKSLFPDNTYGKDSGGNPKYIPTLTREYYLDFYRKYYHPSNSYIYLYGDMDIEERLRWMDREYLSHYDRITVDSEVPLQKGFAAVKEVTAQFPISMDESEEDQTYLSANFVVCDASDARTLQAFDVLDYALVSAPGAPVRKALIDAGIGASVYGSYLSDIRQPVFSFVAQNANERDKERFVAIIRKTLSALVEEGINRDALLAGINSAEFRFREADFGRFPKGLLYGIHALDGWLYDENQPFRHLECLDDFAFLKEQIATGYFEELVQKYFLDNTHASIVVVKPKKGAAIEEEQQLAKELEAYKASLSEDEIKALIEHTARLKAYQAEPTSEEDLQKIPMLSREDLRKEALPLSNQEKKIADVPVLHHDIDTNGIDYVALLFEAEDIAQEDVPALAFLRSVIGYVNAGEYSYEQLADVINIYTGGITGNLGVYSKLTAPERPIFRYEVHVKVLEENLFKALDFVHAMLTESDFSDRKRIGEILAQSKARLQSSLSASGSAVAAQRALSYESAYAWYRDATTGVAYYRWICEALARFETDPDAVIGSLLGLAKKVFAKERLLLSVTAQESAYESAEPALLYFVSRFPQTGECAGAPIVPKLSRKTEGLYDASKITYVARGGNFRKHGYSYSGYLRILENIIAYDYLWLNVRVLGGAYGCNCVFTRGGESWLTSYRDPKLRETNEVFERIPEYLRDFDPDERDMTKYIIGTFSTLDAPLSPEAKGIRSLISHLQGLAFETIQRERDQILSAQADDIRGLADLMEKILSDHLLCVIGNESLIHKEEALFGEIRALL